jgi:hypothetical protein
MFISLRWSFLCLGSLNIHCSRVGPYLYAWNEAIKKSCVTQLQQIYVIFAYMFQFEILNNLQDNGLVPIVEPEILLDGGHGIERALEVAEKVWSEVFFYLAQNNVLFEGVLLKPSMVTPGAEHKEKASPEAIAKHTLTMLRRRVPPAVPGIMVLIVPSLTPNQLLYTSSICSVSHKRRLHN